MKKLNRPIVIMQSTNSFQLKVRENDEVLVPVQERPRLFQKPMYYEWKFPHALPTIYLREGVLKRLEQAVNLLPEEYGLLVYDGYRPIEVQKHLFQMIYEKHVTEYPHLSEDEVFALTRKFVALPSEDKDTPSPHLTGGAVDITLCLVDGTPVNMGSDFDSTVEQSATAYFEREDGDAVFRLRRRYLYHAMESVGFFNYHEEWWHYDYGNSRWAAGRNEKMAIYGIAKFSKK